MNALPFTFVWPQLLWLLLALPLLVLLYLWLLRKRRRSTVRLASLADTAQILEPRAFVFRVASNLAIDRLRQEQRRSALHDDDSDHHEYCDPLASPEKQFLAAEAIEQLDRSLAQLPSKARLALLLNRLEGLTHAQIAVRLDVSESTVGKYIVQAMRHCRDWLRQSECL